MKWSNKFDISRLPFFYTKKTTQLIMLQGEARSWFIPGVHLPGNSWSALWMVSHGCDPGHRVGPLHEAQRHWIKTMTRPGKASIWVTPINHSCSPPELPSSTLGVRSGISRLPNAWLLPPSPSWKSHHGEDKRDWTEYVQTKPLSFPLLPRVGGEGSSRAPTAASALWQRRWWQGWADGRSAYPIFHHCCQTYTANDWGTAGLKCPNRLGLHKVPDQSPECTKIHTKLLPITMKFEQADPRWGVILQNI